MIKAEDLRIGDLVRVSRDCMFPKGSIKKLIGRELTWNDEPVELKY